MKRFRRKILAALFLLVLTLALSSTVQALVECTSATYFAANGYYVCTQCFVSTIFGWISLGEPDWDFYQTNLIFT